MRTFFENSLIMIGIATGLILFLVGVRRALKAREPRTAADKILIAASITILSLMPNGLADDEKADKEEREQTTCYLPAPQIKYGEIIKRKIEFIKGEDRWKELCKAWSKILPLVITEEPLTSDLMKWVSETEDMLKEEGWQNKRKKYIEPDAEFLSADDALNEITAMTAKMAKTHHLVLKGIVEADEDFKGQDSKIKNLLDKLEKRHEKGVLSEEIYNKIKLAVAVYDRSHTGIAEGFTNKHNSMFVFELLKELGIASLDEPDLRVLEVIQSKEWQKLKQIWVELDGLLKENKPLTGELKTTIERISSRRNWDGISKRKDQPEDAPLLTLAKIIDEMQYLAINKARHIERLHAANMECYQGAILEQKNIIKEQEKLLDKMSESGKIDKDIYAKVKRSIDAFKRRGTEVARGLNKKNSVLIFRLIKEISAQHDGFLSIGEDEK